MQRVPVKPEMLRWARERAGLSVEELEKAFPRLREWDAGDALPTLKQLQQYAKRTWTPFGYFFLPEPPDMTLPIPDFRTVGDQRPKMPSPNLLETVHTLQRRQDWMREFLLQENTEPLAFVGSVTLQDRPERVAQDMREMLGITEGWAREHATWTDALLDLRLRVEDAGIVTAWNGVVGNHTRRTLDVKEFRGFVLADKIAPFVFVNTSDAKAAQMFTLVHELAHLWLGRDGVLNLEALQPADNETERFCNRVAAEFLVPKVEMEGLWLDVVNDSEPFQRIARHFKVSPLVAARRALDLGLIQRENFIEFYESYLENDRRRLALQRKKGGGNFYLTAPLRLGRPFAEAVVRATREGKLLYRNAYQLTGLHGKTFDTLAQKLSGEMIG